MIAAATCGDTAPGHASLQCRASVAEQGNTREVFARVSQGASLACPLHRMLHTRDGNTGNWFASEAYEVGRTGLPASRSWQEALGRYVSEIPDKRTMDMDRLHLRQLDPFLRGKRLHEINMDVLWSFVHARPERDGVANATVNRALEIGRRILNLATRSGLARSRSSHSDAYCRSCTSSGHASIRSARGVVGSRDHEERRGSRHPVEQRCRARSSRGPGRPLAVVLYVRR